MIQTQDLEKIVALTLYSSYVADDKPISLMIISDRPEAGKTEIVSKFYGNTGTAFLSDVTAYALFRDFKTQLQNGTLRHIVIPEFLAPLSRKAETVNSLISTLQMLIEEGIMEIHTGFLKPLKLKSPATIGIIICMPRASFKAHQKEWTFSGFLSRFMVASYSYDNGTIDDIFDSIEKRDYIGGNGGNKIKLQFPAVSQHVNIPPAIASQAREMAVKLTSKEREAHLSYGFRELKNVLRMISAHVIYDNIQNNTKRDTATSEDFNEIARLSYLMNDEFNTLKGIDNGI